MNSILIQELQEEVKNLKKELDTKIIINITGNYNDIKNVIKELNVNDIVIEKKENIADYVIGNKFKDFTLGQILNYIGDVIFNLNYEYSLNCSLQSYKLKGIIAEKIFSKLIVINWILDNTYYSLSDINKFLSIKLSENTIINKTELYEKEDKYLTMKKEIEIKIIQNLNWLFEEIK